MSTRSTAEPDRSHPGSPGIVPGEREVDRTARTWAFDRRPSSLPAEEPEDEPAPESPLSASAEAPPARKFPQVGEELFGFRLQKELGRGSFARVFLAHQTELAGRPVVVKVSDLRGSEPQTLAQLQHTHIVPIYSLDEDSDAGVRAVCMPYFGGASLAKVLERLYQDNARPRTGHDLLKALAEAAPAVERSEPRGDESGTLRPQVPPPWKDLSYVEAVIWITARLAEALAHATERGVLHRDVKPSNVLIAADGQPMLLDFNVALNLHGEDAAATRILGGTVAYMAPEHLRALTSRLPNRYQQVDHRSDVYSLGMVLYEMLVGSSPFENQGSYSPVMPIIVAMAHERGRQVPSARAKRPDLPWGVESIVRKGLAPDPAQRYQHAEHLAEDCHRFLDNLPLRHAPELSLVERARKWSRRHPRLTSSASVTVIAALLLLAVGAALVVATRHLAETRQHLAAAQVQDRKRAYQAGAVRALCLVNTVADLRDHLREGVKVCEETLALFSVLDNDNWQSAPDWQSLTEEEQEDLAEDTRELLLSLAWARTRTGTDKQAALRESLALTDRALAVRGVRPSRALWEDRAAYLEQLGELSEAEAARRQAAELQPVTARDHYLLAGAHSRAGRYDLAVENLTRSLELNPQHYWSATQRGICYQELGRYTLAAGDFGTCIGLWPRFAWGYFNRAYALEKSGNRLEALRDYGAALERDPRFVPAYMNRGLLHLEGSRHQEALADFEKAAELGQDDAVLHLARGVALEGLRRFKESDAAFEDGLHRSREGSSELRTRLQWVYGFAVSARLPDRAWEVFESILQRYPEHPQALYGRALLLVEKQREKEALAIFDRLVERQPHFVEPRRYRAVLLARQGAFEGAASDINWCLDREPESGPTLYAAACVAALAAAQSSDTARARRTAAEALRMLEKAFAQGYGPDRAARDPDLESLRELPEFGTLIEGAKPKGRAEKRADE
jgi:serine/threonine protein kinase/tetratricopeptide (TPR) repeat protein